MVTDSQHKVSMGQFTWYRGRFKEILANLETLAYHKRNLHVFSHIGKWDIFTLRRINYDCRHVIAVAENS
jgi:hypothetical protein